MLAACVRSCSVSDRARVSCSASVLGLGDRVVTRGDRGVEPRLEIRGTLRRALRGAGRGRELRGEIGDAGLRRRSLGVERFGLLGQLAPRRLERDAGQVARLGRLGRRSARRARSASRAVASSVSARVGARRLHVEIGQQARHVFAGRVDLDPQTRELAVAGRDRLQLGGDAIALGARVAPRLFDLV